MIELHTPEPWKIADHNASIVICFQGKETPQKTTPYFAGGGSLEAERNANARRIVASVNACAGFSIEELEGASLFNDSISAQDEIDSLKSEVEEMKLIIATDTGTESAVAAMQKQRDELLAALESILPEFRQHSLRNLRDDETSENHRCRVFDHDDHLYEIANKVIASVKANT